MFPKDTCSNKGLTANLEAIAFTQYTLKHGLKKLGKDGVEALGKETEQLRLGSQSTAAISRGYRKKHPSDISSFLPRNDAEESRQEDVQMEESNEQLPASRRHQPP